MYHDRPTIFRLPLPAHESVFFQIVYHQRYISAAAQQFFAQRALRHRPQMQQRFQDAELPHGQTLPFELNAEPGLKRIRGTREIDESTQRALCFRRSFEVSWQSRLTWNHLISKHQMQHNASVIHGLGFLGGPQQNLADKALRRLRDDSLNCMGYVFWLQHLTNIFPRVR